MVEEVMSRKGQSLWAPGIVARVGQTGNRQGPLLAHVHFSAFVP